MGFGGRGRGRAGGSQGDAYWQEQSNTIPLAQRTMNKIQVDSNTGGALWLGGRLAAFNRELVNLNGIGGIVNCTHNLPIPDWQRGDNPEVPALRFSVADALEPGNVGSYVAVLLPIIEFIAGIIEQGKGVFVHCTAGAHRAATVVACYLIFTTGANPQEVHRMIKIKRQWISIRGNLWQSLCGLYDELCERGSAATAAHRRWRLRWSQLQERQAGGSRGVRLRPRMEDREEEAEDAWGVVILCNFRSFEYGFQICFP